MTEQFSKEYYEDGVTSGLSLYKDYRWLPKLTIPMAASIASNLGFTSSSSVLDYGCAKGFLVKAFKYLGYKAYGFDISEYAIANADPEVKGHVFSKITSITEQVSYFDWIISKDVLEHVPYEEIPSVLEVFKSISKRAFIIVPLSPKQGQPYIAPEYELDKTHIIREPVQWWVDLFQSHGFRIDQLSFSMDGVKSSWFTQYPTSNLFITVSS